MTKERRKYLEWIGYNDYEIQEVETEIKDGEEPLVFESNQFYAWESGYNKAKEEMQEQGLELQSDMDKTIEQNITLKKQIEELENAVKKIARTVPNSYKDYSYLPESRLDIIGNICEEVLEGVNYVKN